MAHDDNDTRDGASSTLTVADDTGWVAADGGHESDRSEGGRSQPFAPDTVNGVSRLTDQDVPSELDQRTRIDHLDTVAHYVIDDTRAWRAWTNRRDARRNAEEKWLYFGCPDSMLPDLLQRRKMGPYGDFFPKVLGAFPVYLFTHAEAAARVALRFGMETSGYVVSCRAIVADVFTTQHGNPGATELPKGFTSVRVPGGTDLGMGPLPCSMFAFGDPDDLLPRYITEVRRQAPRPTGAQRPPAPGAGQPSRLTGPQQG